MMTKHYQQLSFYFLLVCYAIFGYTIYATMYNGWRIIPSIYVCLGVVVIVFFMSFKGRKTNITIWTKIRSWFTILFSSILLLIMLLVTFLYAFSSLFNYEEPIEKVTSPDGEYTIQFIRWDQGAAGTFGIRGELNGPLWFTKSIYNGRRVEEVNVEWIRNDVVVINGVEVQL